MNVPLEPRVILTLTVLILMDPLLAPVEVVTLVMELTVPVCSFSVPRNAIP